MVKSIWENSHIKELKKQIKLNKKYGLTVAFEEAAMKLPKTLNSISRFYYRNINLFK